MTSKVSSLPTNFPTREICTEPDGMSNNGTNNEFPGIGAFSVPTVLPPRKMQRNVAESYEIYMFEVNLRAVNRTAMQLQSSIRRIEVCSNFYEKS